MNLLERRQGRKELGATGQGQVDIFLKAATTEIHCRDPKVVFLCLSSVVKHFQFMSKQCFLIIARTVHFAGMHRHTRAKEKK